MNITWLLITSGIAFGLSSKHVVGPVMVRANSSLPANREFDELPADYPLLHLPPRFPQQLYALEGLGFSLVRHLVSRPDQKQLRMLVSLLKNQETKTMASLVWITSTAGTKRITNDFLEFTTEFADGFEVNTVNSSTVNVFHRVPERAVVKVPHVKDVSDLCLVHSHMVAKQVNRRAVLPPEGHEVEHFRASFEKCMAQQVARGYFFLDGSTQRYRHTWIGAIRSTWRLLWPAKQILQHRQAREGRLIAEAAGVRF
jgi:hypothetical protein